MRIFLICDDINKFGESDYASIEPAQESQNLDFVCVDWAEQTGLLSLSSTVPVSIEIEQPLPDFAIYKNQLAVFNPKSEKIQDLFKNSKVEWLACEVVASFDDDILEEVPLVEAHSKLELSIINPLVRCKIAPGAAISTVGENGFWNVIEDIDNMSLYLEELEQSDVFRIEGCPLPFCNVPFKKKAKELGVTGVRFDRISTLTC